MLAAASLTVLVRRDAVVVLDAGDVFVACTQLAGTVTGMYGLASSVNIAECSTNTTSSTTSGSV